nr:oxygenase MpaB family protein [Algoriphagus limi]
MKLYNQEEMDQLRTRQDPLADLAVISLIESPDLAREINGWNQIPDPLPSHFPKVLREYFFFFQEAAELADPDLLKKGQEFFSQTGDIYLGLLGFYSLPYCYAFGDGAQVLVRSKRIVDEIGIRLAETGYFVMELFKPGGFYKDQSPYLTCAKVRLIHAYSRYFISHYATDWKVEYGAPINQEDMLGTNLAFSMIVLRGLTKMGYSIESETFQLVLSYWKWLGALLGVDVKFWPESPKEAFELDRLIRKRHMKSTKAGKRLISALAEYYKHNIPDQIVRNQVDSLFSFFLGKEASQVLGISSEINLPGSLVDLIFKFSGWKNYGSKKTYQKIRSMMETQQKEQFGKLIQLQIPVLERS